jgi:Ca2+-binding RTX toxin-like protein
MQNVQLSNRMTFNLGVPFAQILMLQGLSACGGGSSEVSDDLQPELNTINGSPNADYIRGTSDADIIFGMSGNDRILSFGGDDVINPGSGIDTVFAGDGDDKIYISALSQHIDGGDGNDTVAIEASLANLELFIDLDQGVVRASNQNNQLTATLVSIENILSISNKDTQVNGSPASNNIITGDGNDLIYSGNGNNIITTSGGNDQVTLGLGRHSIDLGSGNDIVNNIDFGSTILGNSGFDELNFATSDATANLIINLSTNTISDNRGNVTNLSSFEKITVTGPNSVQFTGTASDDFFEGDEGNDNFNGGGGNDQFFGGAGQDTFLVTQNGTVTIKDFEAGNLGDAIFYAENKNPSTPEVKLRFIDIKSGPQSRLTDSNDILIITSETGFESDTVFLLALNGLSGVKAHTETALINAEMLSIWFNNNSNMCEVSILTDTNSDNALDTIVSIAHLEGISVDDLESLSIENFQII